MYYLLQVQAVRWVAVLRCMMQRDKKTEGAGPGPAEGDADEAAEVSEHKDAGGLMAGKCEGSVGGK